MNTTKIFTNVRQGVCPLTIFQIFESCEQRIHYISLTDQSIWYETSSDPIYIDTVEQLSPFFIEEIETKSWYAYYLGEPSFPEKLVVKVYRYCEAVKEILTNLSGVTNIYFEDERHRLITAHPMDLCLYRQDGGMIFGSVSHEHLASFFLDENEIIGNEVLKWFDGENRFKPRPFSLKESREGLLQSKLR